MELFSPEFFSALLAIVVIDLVLAGDNAIVIALAARGLPAHQQKKVIVWGTVGAIVIRTAMTFAVVWLLKIPGLMLVGGLLLLWIAYKLIMADTSAHHDGASTSNASLWAAIKTIIIADSVMGIDNVLGVAGAAHGSFLLVVLGLLISVPIMVFGSSLVLKWIERFPAIVYIGAAVLAWTAASMITKEPWLATYLSAHDVMKWGVYAIAVIAVLALGYLKSKPRVEAQIT